MTAPTQFSLRSLLSYGSLFAALTLGCSSTNGDPGDGAGGSALGAGGTGTGGSTIGAGGTGTGGETPTSGGSENGTGGGGSDDVPTDTSESGIKAFLDAESYKTWRHDATPRPLSPDLTTNPHQPLMVAYFNETAVASRTENDGTEAKPHTVGAMVIKEVLDQDNSVISRAVGLKTGPGRIEFTWYCDGDAAACGASRSPFHATGLLNDCGFCHGGNIFSAVPSP